MNEFLMSIIAEIAGDFEVQQTETDIRIVARKDGPEALFLSVGWTHGSECYLYVDVHFTIRFGVEDSSCKYVACQKVLDYMLRKNCGKDFDSLSREFAQRQIFDLLWFLNLEFREAMLRKFMTEVWIDYIEKKFLTLLDFNAFSEFLAYCVKNTNTMSVDKAVRHGKKVGHSKEAVQGLYERLEKNLAAATALGS